MTLYKQKCENCGRFLYSFHGSDIEENTETLENMKKGLFGKFFMVLAQKYPNAEAHHTHVTLYCKRCHSFDIGKVLQLRLGKEILYEAWPTCSKCHSSMKPHYHRNFFYPSNRTCPSCNEEY